MKRQVLYSGSRRTPGAGRGATGPADTDLARHSSEDGRPERSKGSLDSGVHGDDATDDSAGHKPRWLRLHALGRRHSILLRFLAGGALAVLVVAAYLEWQARPPALTQEDIDAAVVRTFENRMLPSRATKAADMVLASVVRVNGYGDPAALKGPPKDKSKRFPHKIDRGVPDKKGDADSSVAGLEQISLGSGFVIVDDGTILTNLHVVMGAKRVTVTFHDGSESAAELVSAHPENDLAVIRAQKIPDDLPIVTLGSASRLKLGDEVVAVGFPFGMGPSVSSGVVSGLNREFRSPEGERLLTRLIQFDAAANLGNSGGPLVTMQGDVVGIVTAIMNPTESGTFIGIGFAVTIAAAGRAVGIHPF